MKKSNDLKTINNNRTKIMGFAALWIFIFHSWITINNNTNSISSIYEFIIRIGFCGVDIFMLLSGFGLVNSIKKGTKTFYYNRIKRISFTYVLASILAIFIYKWTLLEFIQNISFYTYFTKPIYSHLWFIPTILIFYLLFPIYYKLFEKAKNKNIFIILTIIIWFIISFLLKGYIKEEIYGITNRIPIFITGIWMGWFITEKSFKFPKGFLLINIIILIIGFQLCYLTSFKGLTILLPVSNSLVNYFVALPITILLAKLFDICSIKYVNNFFEFYGTISLQLYCFQEILLKYLYAAGVYIQFKPILVIVLKIVFFIFVTIIAKSALSLEKIFWNKIEHKKIEHAK